MREVEQSLQRFSEFLLRGRLVRANAAPYIVGWVRQFLSRPATVDPLVDRVRRSCEDLERAGRQDWQVRQAEQSLRIYFVNFLDCTDWRATQVSGAIDGDGRAEPLAALQELRARLRTRHYSLRTESSYVERDGPRPVVTAAAVRDFLTHLAVHRRVSASTQNQAQCALLFLAREVLGLEVDGLSQATRAKRGQRLPVVLSVPETASLLQACGARTGSWHR